MGIWSTHKTDYENFTNKQLHDILGTHDDEEEPNAPLKTIETLIAIKNGSFDVRILNHMPNDQLEIQELPPYRATQLIRKTANRNRNTNTRINQNTSTYTKQR